MVFGDAAAVEWGAEDVSGSGDGNHSLTVAARYDLKMLQDTEKGVDYWDAEEGCVDAV